MKKYFNLLCMLMTISLFMVGCGATKTLESQNNERDLSRQQTIQKLDERLENQGYNTISNSANSKIEQEIDGHLYKCEQYQFSQGLSLYFISDAKTDELVQLSFKAEKDLILTDRFELFGYMMISLTGVLEPTNYEDLCEQLEMNSDSDTINTTTTMDLRQYHYNRNDTTQEFIVTVPEADIINIDDIDFKNGEITPEKIDFTIDSFIEKYDSVMEGDGIPLLTNIESTTFKDDTSIEFENFKNCKSYLVLPGLMMNFYESESGRLEGILYYFNFKDSVKDSFTYLIRSFIMTTHILDDAKYDDITENIDLADFENVPNTYNGAKMKYYHNFSDGMIVVLISRISPMVVIDTENSNNN